jgi:hypothetical protein
VSIINTSHLMIFKEIIAVCCKNNMEDTDKRYGQSADFIVLQQARFVVTATYPTGKGKLSGPNYNLQTRSHLGLRSTVSDSNKYRISQESVNR